MTEDLNLRVNPRTAASEKLLRSEAAAHLAIPESEVHDIRIVRRSIDARQKRVMVNLALRVAFADTVEVKPDFVPVEFNDVSGCEDTVLIVGAGPAGLFAALKALELGIRPIVIERGKDVDARRLDLASLNRTGTVLPDSNYCFGEGGAGTFSDGKLFTRSKKRGDLSLILRLLHQHGADESILIDSHPHIGSDRLPFIIKSIRQTIIGYGGEVRFDSRVESILLSESRDKAIGIETADGERLFGPVVLATGHSARDVYRMLKREGISIEAKGLAIGVRLEHPQHLIDCIQYHSPQGRGRWLPPAEYSFVCQAQGRGVYSFCMCPGGYVVNASSEDGYLAVNGMSYSKRDGENANSAVVVTVTPEDFGGENVLAGMEFQRELEERAYREGGGKIPVQTFRDYCRNIASQGSDFVVPQIKGGYAWANVRRIFPEQVAAAIEEGIFSFDRKIKGYAADGAVLSGVESRTSSPIRILRDETGQSALQGLFPCGEGAGYAGGITSAAMDGILIAEKVAMLYTDMVR